MCDGRGGRRRDDYSQLNRVHGSRLFIVFIILPIDQPTMTHRRLVDIGFL